MILSMNTKIRILFGLSISTSRLVKSYIFSAIHKNKQVLDILEKTTTFAIQMSFVSWRDSSMDRIGVS